MSQGSSFLAYSFNNTDVIKASFEFVKEEGQSQHLKDEG